MHCSIDENLRTLFPMLTEEWQANLNQWFIALDNYDIAFGLFQSVRSEEAYKRAMLSNEKLIALTPIVTSTIRQIRLAIPQKNKLKRYWKRENTLKIIDAYNTALTSLSKFIELSQQRLIENYKYFYKALSQNTTTEVATSDHHNESTTDSAITTTEDKNEIEDIEYLDELFGIDEVTFTQ